MAVHWRQKTDVANPLRFRSTIACSPLESVVRIRLRQGGAQHDIGPGRRILLAHVDNADVSERTVEHAAIQRNQGIAPLLGVLVTLHRRRRRAQDRERPCLTRAHDGDVAAVVTRRLFLLVRAVVLLVDDDQTDCAQRREDSRSRADDDVDVAAPDAVPLIVTLAVGEAAVLDGDALAERLPERHRDRRRQRDLGHEQEDAAALPAHVGGKPQVQLCLSAPGDAVQERGLELAAIGERSQSHEGRVLFGRENEGRALRGCRWDFRAGTGRDRPDVA